MRRLYMTGQYSRKDVGNEFDGPSLPFGALVDYIPITAKDKSIVHQLGKKTLKVIFLDYVLRGRARLVRRLDTSRLWRFTEIRSLKKSTSKDSKVKMYSYQKYTVSLCKRKIETSYSSKIIRERNLEQEHEVEIEEGDRRESKTEDSWFMSGEFIIDITRNLVWSFTTQTMKDFPSHWYTWTQNSDEDKQCLWKYHQWHVGRSEGCQCNVNGHFFCVLPIIVMNKLELQLGNRFLSGKIHFDEVNFDLWKTVARMMLVGEKKNVQKSHIRYPNYDSVIHLRHSIDFETTIVSNLPFISSVSWASNEGRRAFVNACSDI